MKHLIFLVVLNFFVYSIVFAQDIKFTFITKDTNSVIDSIRAINLTTGESVLVKGTNEISFTSTSVNTDKITDNIKIYPNPSSGQAEIQFYSHQKDNVKISLVNAAGQIVASTKQQLNEGFHKFSVTTKSNGLYFLQVIGDKNKYSEKIISNGNYNYNNSIRYISFNSKIMQEKSTVLDEADVIHFYIYSGENVTKIADSPTDSKTYEVEFFECNDYDGRNYPIVQIGEQWWMAENVAYLPKVSPQISSSSKTSNYYVYDYYDTIVGEAKEAHNYKIFGALYNWPAAKTSCPTGWHLPTDDEWEELAQYVSNEKGPYNKFGDNWYDVGKHLKSTYWILGPVPLDDIGFSGLPGGVWFRERHYGNMEIAAYWWSATESNSTSVHAPSLNYIDKDFVFASAFKGYGLSVRCVKNDSDTPLEVMTSEITKIAVNSAESGGLVISEGSSELLSTGVCWNNTGTPTIKDSLTSDGKGLGPFTSDISGLEAKTTYYLRAYAINSQDTAYGEEKIFTTLNTSGSQSGMFVDERDSIEYKWVQIGEQIWMAENLAYLPSVNSPTDNFFTESYYSVYGYTGSTVSDARQLENYKNYGALYNWPAAKFSCPIGWHLPTDDEWEELAQYVSDLNGGYVKSDDDWYNVGRHLKATSGWNDDGNGTDDFGFSGLPGGVQIQPNIYFVAGITGGWWSAVEENSISAWVRNLVSSENGFGRNYIEKSNGLSVRCIKNDFNTPFEVLTGKIAQVKAFAAEIVGKVISEGDSEVILRGMCWNKTGIPTIYDNSTDDGEGIGEFTGNLTGLEPKTEYSARAYAINSQDTVYGDEKIFTTLYSVLVVITGEITEVTYNSAKTSGEVVSDGDSEIISRGVCWNDTGIPTVYDNFTVDGKGLGQFTSDITGLEPETTYFVRAYAINAQDTAYGEEVSFNIESQEIELQELQQLITSLKADGNQVDSTETDLYYIIEKDGTGEMAQFGDTLTIIYSGYLANGTLIDNSSGLNDDGTWEFVFEERMLIPGFEAGLMLMNKGMEIKMIIPSFLAYGSSGAGQIPPYSILVFDVTMVEIKR